MGKRADTAGWARRCDAGSPDGRKQVLPRRGTACRAAHVEAAGGTLREPAGVSGIIPARLRTGRWPLVVCALALLGSAAVFGWMAAAVVMGGGLDVDMPVATLARAHQIATCGS